MYARKTTSTTESKSTAEIWKQRRFNHLIQSWNGEGWRKKKKRKWLMDWRRGRSQRVSRWWLWIGEGKRRRHRRLGLWDERRRFFSTWWRIDDEGITRNDSDAFTFWVVAALCSDSYLELVTSTNTSISKSIPTCEMKARTCQSIFNIYCIS